jgi:hypothetical protein
VPEDERCPKSTVKLPFSYYLIALVAVVAGVEALYRLPFRRALRGLGATTRKARRVLTSKRISEHWKEKAVTRYSLLLLGDSLRLLFAIVALGAVVIAVTTAGLVLSIGRNGIERVIPILMDPSVEGIMLVAGVVYGAWRFRRLT